MAKVVQISPAASDRMVLNVRAKDLASGGIRRNSRAYALIFFLGNSSTTPISSTVSASASISMSLASRTS